MYDKNQIFKKFQNSKGKIEKNRIFLNRKKNQTKITWARLSAIGFFVTNTDFYLFQILIHQFLLICYGQIENSPK